MMIMSEDVKNAIIYKLLEIFPDISVYKEAKTSLSYPHFFVYQINFSCEEERKGYFFLDYSMDIRYRVASDSSTDLKLQQNLDNVSLLLFTYFDIIEINDLKIKCKNKRVEKVDGILHFLCDFRILCKLNKNEVFEKQNKLEVRIDGR